MYKIFPGRKGGMFGLRSQKGKLHKEVIEMVAGLELTVEAE